jgi:hypothetical protein
MTIDIETRARHLSAEVAQDQIRSTRAKAHGRVPA